MQGQAKTLGEPFEVVRAGFDDLDLVRKTRLEALADAPAAFCSSIERELARENWVDWVTPSSATYLVVGLERGTSSGAALGIGCFHVDQLGRGSLTSVWVDPSLRGSHAAQSLMSSLADWGFSSGVNKIFLEVTEGNERALRCYQRLGYRLTGARRGRDKDDLAELEMVLVRSPDWMRPSD